MSTGPSPADAPDLIGRRVLHVVQKYSSGVGSAIAQYTRSLPEMEHHLLSGTAVDAEGDLAEQADFTGAQLMRGSALAKVRSVREVVDRLRPDVVHAHSSHGGGYARLAVARRRFPLVYTPHCYAFERRDVSAPVRASFWALEALMAINTSVFAACSARELELSEWPTRRAPRYLVPNIAPSAGVRIERSPGSVPLIAGGGRLSPQKDPRFFQATLRGLRATHPGLRAVWLGDGDVAQREALRDDGIEVTGWLPRRDALELLAGADLYVHSARWEGFPLMVAEAVSLGVPTLVRRLPCFGDIPDELTLDGTGDLGSAAACVVDEDAAAANVSRWAWALQGNTLSAQRAALVAVYRDAVRGPR